jgi:hypothetical protein
MQDNIAAELLAKLERFEQRLQARKNANAVSEGASRDYDKFREKHEQIQSRLKHRLESSRGIDWELLKLELQNDLLLLTNSFESWSRRLDARFNRER